ncbi:hypothetical protein PR048_000240 [Dryococelus australis]|uniref:Uncharacterized protein n=1 Tax=Dryococelus australis TaxID=614101 RepID=A0ABQ9IE32_9NEOP|nr:hypothetical protein PR048_000240 [Dryococelus australis]
MRGGSVLPPAQANMEMLHDLVSKDQLAGMQQVLEKDLQATKGRSLALCKDQSGVGLLHKAVYNDYQDIAQFLVAFNPAIVHVKDKVRRP